MAQKFRFVCPACGGRIVVDRHVRDEMLAQGCAVCSTAVSPSCFDSI